MDRSSSSLELIQRRHSEWIENQLRWRWLLDSVEGGERYRNAVYGYDRRGLPIRNLVRHKREYPDPREGMGSPSFSSMSSDFAGTIGEGSHGIQSTDDDYELRRARTPIPTFMSEALDTHLSRIYAREVRRVGPEALAKWWDDVDGCGTSIDDWMAQTIAPLLLTLGQLDVCMDHPKAPEGESIETRADVERLGLDRCVAAYILPENMLWWRIDDATHRYLECLVLERHELDDRTVERFRHWTATDSTLYDEEGTLLSKIEHGFGRVPIVRVFDRRKPRANNIGQSRYESVAERQREYYNRDSELILSDSTQAHPLISGPEDYVQSDGTIPIGPGWLLPKLRVANGSSVAYEGFEVIDFPKGASESIRENMKNIRSEVDRDSALVHREGREVRGQSGLSKALDLIDGNNRLAKISRTLARTERILCDLALLVLHDGANPSIQPLEIEIVYPTEFDLYTASDMARTVEEFQSLVSNAGSLPTTEFLMLSRLLRLCLPGMSDRQYAMCDDEIRSHLEGTSERTRTGRDRNSQSIF